MWTEISEEPSVMDIFQVLDLLLVVYFWRPHLVFHG